MIQGQGYYKCQVGDYSRVLAVLGKNEYLCTFILERRNEYLDLRESWILLGNWMLTSWCLNLWNIVRDEIFLRFSSVGRFSFDNIIIADTACGAVVVEYVSYGPVLNHFNFIDILFLPWVPYSGRIFN